MKKLLSLLFVLGLTLSACGPSQTQPAPPARTFTPTISPTDTQTPTITVTPLPTIPTFTPTFDVSTIVTVTPAEKAECPKENLNILPSFPIRTNENFFVENSTEILKYLNDGGELSKAAERLAQARYEKHTYEKQVVLEDVTGDTVPELLFVDYAKEPMLHIYSCKGGQYLGILPEVSDNLTGYSTAIQATVNDLNQNGIPDVLLRTSCSRGLGCTSLFILEWDGSEFINRIEPRELFVGATERNIIDTNNDGILELVIKEDVNGGYAYFMGFPSRISTRTYMWNGSQFALQDIQYEEPEYQFQALQDSDRSVLLKDFDSAMELYNMTIADQRLLSYSSELSKHMEWLYWNPMSITSATEPPPDLTEYPRLAAYAYYRILLLHLVQGGEAEAASTYQTLQETFGDDPYAAPYVEMASAFWEAYQSAHKMYDGCAAAIHFAVEHPEILIPLGSDYHGWQSHIYEPADVCPFR